ncbi:type IV secretory system conjugative DNA transfer family protein [Kitasatospora sp. NPDC058397]|uniref:type IV secretory system conjugative DNA transfer family protein n=1 Tax=unclassified Kitasatospora TaxID=2633591 RepID=UPI003650D7A3
MAGLLLAVLAILAMLAQGNKAEFNRSVDRFFDALAQGIGRYFSGRDLFEEEQRSASTAWRAGPPPPDDERDETPVGELGLRTKAASPPVSLAKPRRRPLAMRIVLAPFMAVLILLRALGGLWRVLRVWHRWPRAARVAVRLLPVPVAWGLWRFPDETRLALIAGAGAVYVAALTSPAGLAWWRVTPVWTDGQIYGPGLWVALRQALRMEETEPHRRWLSVPDDMAAEGARIVLRIPIKWLGTPEARAAVERVVDERAPGEWVARWERTKREHYVEWTPKPKPPERVKLPDYVPWEPTGDPRKVFVGLAIENNEIVSAIVHTQSATPHWGVAGDTGSGKSTVLYIPVVHGRQNGELIDVLDTKRNSLAEADGHSGVRIHKDTRACIAAFAEFLASMMAAEAAMEKGADPALRSQLIARTLVIDELPTLIKLAYTWWRYGLKGKGTPPFLDWLGIILLQGRSSNHRVVVGTQQFANSYFGGTMERAQIGTRIAVGQQDRVSWGVAFGQSTPVLGYDADVKGRGAYSDKRKHPTEDYLYVREIQPSYITPDVSRLLSQCADAPAWFDSGEMAPWITAEVLDMVNHTAATMDFLPGGKFGPMSRTAVGPAAGRGVAQSLPMSQGATPLDATGSATAPATAAAAVPQPAQAAEVPVEETLPDTYTLAEAHAAKILPWKPATFRTYVKRGVERGIPAPEGVSDGGPVSYYSEAELRDWIAKWEEWQQKNNVKKPRPAPDESDAESTPSA